MGLIEKLIAWFTQSDYAISQLIELYKISPKAT